MEATKKSTKRTTKAAPAKKAPAKKAPEIPGAAALQKHEDPPTAAVIAVR